ncbi:MAG TPA: hypothetical protein VK054_12670 [Beutenbergiaceae bacterium]|nr:hypothetical protein [Beutenbergiaceae bacterium]
MNTPNPPLGPRHRAEPGDNHIPLTTWGKIGMTIFWIVGSIYAIAIIWGFFFARVGKEWVQCDVVDVGSRKVGAVGTTRGWATILDTSNCGNVAIFKDIRSKEDAQQLATTFTPGDTVELHMGYFDRNISKYLPS